MKLKKFTTMLFAAITLSIASVIPAFAMEQAKMDRYCDQVIEVLASEDKDMVMCSKHIPLQSSSDNWTEISSYFHYAYYCGDTNILFGYSNCKEHGPYGCMQIESIGSSKTAAQQHKEAKAKIAEWAATIDNSLSVKEKADAVYDIVTSHVTYGYNSEEDARAALNKTRNGYLCYDGTNITAYAGAMRGKAVCMGHAILYKQLCDLKEVPCEVIKNDRHAFNMVKIDGVEYLYDTVNAICKAGNIADMSAIFPEHYAIHSRF